ncbi:MAG: UDP-N-acetylmuramate dehydrogenase [Bacteroides sp.]|nr:UDP-N-acetylmuramate dehydrogenase [Bacteroides sp.]
MDHRRIESICERYGAEYKENERLASYTSFKIGGRCPVLIKPNGTDCLREIVSVFDSERVEYRVIGKGSNILVSDKGVGFPVVSLSDMAGAAVDGEVIRCGAGMPLMKLCGLAAEHGLSGLEFAYGIPGSVGGAVCMNAGAYGGEMKDVVSECSYIAPDGSIVTAAAEELEFSYRRSFFSGKKHIITEIVLTLRKGDKEEIQSRMNELMQRRRDKQPLEYPSAGSTFKRPEGDFAGRLIEAAGLKGCSLGGAQVSEKHCGFVVNKGGAVFEDVKGLIEIIRERVRESSGVSLEPEIVIWE